MPRFTETAAEKAVPENPELTGDLPALALARLFSLSSFLGVGAAEARCHRRRFSWAGWPPGHFVIRPVVARFHSLWSWPACPCVRQNRAAIVQSRRDPCSEIESPL